MPAVFWIAVGVLFVVAALSGGGKKNAAKKGPYRTDRPHLVDPDDYECSACRRRFRKDVPVCPYCGAKFTGRVKDESEFELEADEMESWDEEEGR